MEATLEADQLIYILKHKGIVRVHYSKGDPDKFSLWAMTEDGYFKCLDLSQGAEKCEIHFGGSSLSKAQFTAMLKGKTVSFIIKPGKMVQHEVSKW